MIPKPQQVTGELELIERIRNRIKVRSPRVRIGIGDDCAVLRTRVDEELVVTTDFSLEGRHFRRDWHSSESAGHRCLARGLSDLAAMGARPVSAFLSLALPKHLELDWIDGFLSGFAALAEAHRVELAGGDTAESPGKEILADIVLIGATSRGKALLRRTARVGDLLYVTGSLGGSAKELAELSAGHSCGRAAAKNCPQSFPMPRLAAGQALGERGLATACMDLSDGLSSDLRRLCDQSNVGAEIEVERLPIAPGATLAQALHGGEDYELLFTAAPKTKLPARLGGVPITRIGRIVAHGVHRLDGELRQELQPQGYEHFNGDAR